MRRLLLFALFVSSCVAEPRPNILLIVADDLGYGDVSAYGCKEFKTPHLDAVANAGMRFTSGYVTAPVCGPSRAALLTGRHNCRILPYDGNPPPGSEAGLPLNHKTLANHLKAAGYRTAAMGKWHLGETTQHHPMSRGFDEFFGFLSGMHNYFKAEDEKWGPLLRGREKTELKEYLTFALADEACAFIRRPSPEPYFLYLAFNAPHVPLEAPENYLAKTAHITDARRRVCAAMILALDDAIGRVMAAVDQRNTLVVFLSDNGAALIKGSAENGGSNAPLRGSKAQLWEGGIRVPFFMQWPGRVAAGGVSDAPVSSLDLLPTLLAASSHHAPRDESLDGVNLLPWLEGKAESPKRGHFFWKFGVGQFAIRSGDMKLVRVNADKGLFNVREDISETIDRSTARPIVARQLEAAWKKWDADNLIAPRLSRIQKPRKPAAAVGIEQEAGVWWFRSPVGKHFLSIGMNHVEPVYWRSPNNERFVLETYGSDLFTPDGQFNDGSEAARKWASRVATNLKSWGFNTLGMHNPPLTCLRTTGDVYFVVELGMPVPWGWNMKRSELIQAFKRRPLDVFADAFVAEVQSNAVQWVKPWADSPRVLGYAYSDGPPWTIDDDVQDAVASLHPWVLALMSLPAEAKGKQAWLALMKERYASAAAAGATYGLKISSWDELATIIAWTSVADKTAATGDSDAFLEKLMRQWYDVRRSAIRAHDQHHLILGDKLNANRDARHSEAMTRTLRVLKDYVDVIFIQYYAPADEQCATLATIYQATQKPILIGDTACRPLWKDEDPSNSGYYSELGQVYADHVTKLFALPYVVGWHHCGYMRGLRTPYVAALKRGDQQTVEHHRKTRTTLREGFITELEAPIEQILTPLSLAISKCETVHKGIR
ncbi:MAG: hypothetical protein FJ395_16710 [Verrucomicrobia bacterium]|nr:hypothetical protein [Verrucomicrobiota bacterium]